MARTLWLYNLYRALCTAHVHKAVFVFVFLARGLSMAEILLLQTIAAGGLLALLGVQADPVRSRAPRQRIASRAALNSLPSNQFGQVSSFAMSRIVSRASVPC